MKRSLRHIARGSARPAALLLLTCALAPAAVAQTGSTERFLVSTTVDAGVIDPLLPDLTDTDLIAVGAGALPAPWITAGHWAALADFVPRDVDGVDILSDTPGAGDLYMSFLSNEGGFLDGDIVRLTAGGAFEVAVSEQLIATALGDANLNVDVDGFAFDGAQSGVGGIFAGGIFVFSLSSDVDSPVLGPVANGDVLELTESGVLTRRFSEEDVAAALTLATGSGAAVGDVHAIEVVGGETWVALQSPSEFDGAVLALGANARLVADEVDLALGGEEIDALTVLTTEMPLSLWSDATLGGATGRGVIQNATPNGPVLVLGGGDAGWMPLPQMGGFGALAIDPNDVLLGALLAGPSLPIYWSDANGLVSLLASFPAAGTGSGPGDAQGLTLQALDVLSGRLSAPFRVLP